MTRGRVEDLWRYAHGEWGWAHTHAAVVVVDQWRAATDRVGTVALAGGWVPDLREPTELNGEAAAGATGGVPDLWRLAVEDGLAVTLAGHWVPNLIGRAQSGDHADALAKNGAPHQWGWTNHSEGRIARNRDGSRVLSREAADPKQNREVVVHY